MRSNNVIIQPIMTEKASEMAGKKTYMFEVNLKSNKNTIATLIEKLYKVKVGHVRVMTRPGKPKRVGKFMKTKVTAHIKIAYITLKEGTLDIFPQA